MKRNVSVADCRFPFRVQFHNPELRIHNFAGSMQTQTAAVTDRSGGASGCQPLLEIRSVAKRFSSTRVLAGVSLNIDQGEFLTILGASGSGKTTLLRLVAGLELPDECEIWMAGERLDTLPPYRRRVNTVFQSYALFPHLSVRENVSYGLQVSGVAKG